MASTSPGDVFGPVLSPSFVENLASLSLIPAAESAPVECKKRSGEV